MVDAQLVKAKGQLRVTAEQELEAAVKGEPLTVAVAALKLALELAEEDGIPSELVGRARQVLDISRKAQARLQAAADALEAASTASVVDLPMILAALQEAKASGMGDAQLVKAKGQLRVTAEQELEAAVKGEPLTVDVAALKLVLELAEKAGVALDDFCIFQKMQKTFTKS